MALSTYLGNALLNELLKNTNFAQLASVYLSYHTADPGLTGSNEVSGNGYARVQAVPASWGTVASKTVSNVAALTFPTSTGNQGTVTHVGFWDAATSGNFLLGYALTSPVTIGNGNIPQFGVGALTVTAT